MKVSSAAVYKLTLLWAFAEGGLGGLLHGFHIPVTGFVLGGFSVVIISFMAYLSLKPGRDVVQATLLVLVIKFAVSPHSPLPAYVAVFFQGMLGALIFSVLGRNRFSILLFSALALAESALQKPLLATLFFGNELWLAVDELATKLLGLTDGTEAVAFSRWVVAVYAGSHVVWGVIVGLWAFQLPGRVEKIRITHEMILDAAASMTTLPSSKRGKKNLLQIVLPLLICLLILYTLPMAGRWLYLLRTVVIILVVYGVLTPIMRNLLKKWSVNNSEAIQAYWQELPSLSRHSKIAWRLATVRQGYLKRATHFVVTIFWLTLFTEEENG